MLNPFVRDMAGSRDDLTQAHPLAKIVDAGDELAIGSAHQKVDGITSDICCGNFSASAKMSSAIAPI